MELAINGWHEHRRFTDVFEIRVVAYGMETYFTMEAKEHYTSFV